MGRSVFASQGAAAGTPGSGLFTGVPAIGDVDVIDGFVPDVWVEFCPACGIAHESRPVPIDCAGGCGRMTWSTHGRCLGCLEASL